MKMDLERMQVYADAAVESFRRFLQARFEYVFFTVDEGDVAGLRAEVSGKVVCLSSDGRIEGPFALSIGDFASGDDDFLYYSEYFSVAEDFDDELTCLKEWSRLPADSQLQLRFDCP